MVANGEQDEAPLNATKAANLLGTNPKKGSFVSLLQERILDQFTT
jgi:hypothetical protein